MKENVKKLLIVMIVICIVNIAFDVFLYKNLCTVRSEYETILNEYIHKEEDMFRLNKLVYEMQAKVSAQMITRDTVSFQTNTDTIEALHKEIITVFNHYVSLITNPEEYDLYHLVYSNYVSYKKQEELVENLSGEDSIETAHYYVNTIMSNNLEEMNNNLEKLYTLAESNIQDVYDTLDENKRFTNFVILSFGALSLTIIIILLIIFSRLSGHIFHRFMDEQRVHKEAMIHMQSKTIEGMADLVESRDGETGQHVKNTAHYVEILAKKMSEDDTYKDILTPDYIALLKRFAPLHDIGKIVISDTILLKPGKLTLEEFEKMKLHTVEGGHIIDNILGDIETPENVAIAKNIATCHHEKWDGSGYPAGLSGTDIPLEARIMAVADVFDALISKRCYKKAFTIQSAYDIITDSIGTQFDPAVANAFLSLKPVIEEYLGPEKEAVC